MRMSVGAVLGAVCGLAGCAVLPSLPDDYQFPIDEILRYTTCELRFAYGELDRIDKKRFNAADYTVAIALQPKVDAEYSFKAGLTGKSSTISKYVNSWALGAATGGGAPGAGIGARTHQDGKVSYNVKSVDLIDKAGKFPLNCETWSPAAHALTQNLQIRQWLLSSTKAALVRSNGLAIVDNQGFTAQVYIKYDVGGTFTYTFPFGTDFASASGQYWTDQFLTITITHNATRQVAIFTNTLPSDDFATKGEQVWKRTRSRVEYEAPPGGISPDTKLRLDLLQLQQSIQNLPTAAPR